MLWSCSVICVQINCSHNQSVCFDAVSDLAKPFTKPTSLSLTYYLSTILSSLITSKTRLKLLIKFFSHPDACGYLRGLAEEFGDSTNAVRLELIKLEEAGLLRSSRQGQRVVYEVNTFNPFYSELASMVSKFLGFDDLVELVLKKIGLLDAAYVVGDYARGVDSGTIHLILVGSVNEEVLHELVRKVSDKISRKIEVKVLAECDADNLTRTLRLI